MDLDLAPGRDPISLSKMVDFMRTSLETGS